MSAEHLRTIRDHHRQRANIAASNIRALERGLDRKETEAVRRSPEYRNAVNDLLYHRNSEDRISGKLENAP